jgi:HD-GYP domain-containing protein (c-di-GMP phosphodiesterase class II)
MTTTRSYRASMPSSAELAEYASAQFDPQVVDALAAIVGRSPMTAAAALRA